MKKRTVKLGRFREDPDNVSEATDEEIARLAEKLRRVPAGLTAMRIAYVTDAPGGGCMVISGNKRLRCLKAAFGNNGEVPAEWFQDVTSMSEAERHEFRLNANINDGHWNLDKLLDQYGRDELSTAGLAELLKEISPDDAEDADGETEEYKAFVDKFKPKKTTDDCYTPKNIYDVVRQWAVKEYHLEGREIVRPFWPGGDYQAFDYPPRCVVIDNPPFSIEAEIVRWYLDRRIDFLLFSNYLVNFEYTACNHIIAPYSITYENGAKVDTAFLTNLGESFIRTAPDLMDAIKAADDENLAAKSKTLPKFEYPISVITSAKVGWLCKHHTPYAIKRDDCIFIRRLDAQPPGVHIFGGGYLLSERAAAERAAAERAAAERAAAIKFELSPREIEMQKSLGTK